MKKFSKRTLAWLLSLIMVFTMTTGISFATGEQEDVVGATDPVTVEEQQTEEVVVPIEESVIEEETINGVEEAPVLRDDPVTGGSITVIDGDGVETVITAEMIKAAASAVATEEDPWIDGKGNTYVGTFYSLKSILETAEISYEGAHGIQSVATDGFTNGFAAEDIDNIYIYDMGEMLKNGDPAGATGTYGTAINGAAGNKWAKKVASISVAFDHVWFFKDGECKHYCAICNEPEPSITFTSGDTEVKVYDCQIKAAATAEGTEGTPWMDGKGNTYVGTFYSLKSILETAEISYEDAHGLSSVATDGFTNGFAAEDIDNIYIYDMGEMLKNGSPAGAAGTYGTAINGAAGNKWAKKVASISVAFDHVWFFKDGECKHYCSICDEPEPSITFISSDKEVNVYDCQIKAAASTEATEEEPWKDGKNNTYVGTFYSLKSILETAEISYEDAHGLSSVATDGFTNGFAAEDIDDIYIYDMGEMLKNGDPAGAAGLYGTAINGAAGNKWAKKVASISVAFDHVWFFKDEACKHYCAICGADQPLQEIIDEEFPEADGTFTLSKDMVYEDGAALNTNTETGTRTITIDLNGKTFDGALTVTGGTVILKDSAGGGKLLGNLSADGATLTVESGLYSIEVPEVYCAEGVVPVLDTATGLYEVKEVSAYDTQSTVNELNELIEELEGQITDLGFLIKKLNAEVAANSATVNAKATATAYNKVTLTWEADADVDNFVVQKKVSGEWTDVALTSTEPKLVQKATPGVANNYRVAAQVAYEGPDGTEYATGKYVTASVTTKLAKVVISNVTSKSKKLTVSWKKVSGAVSYTVWVGTNKAVTKGLVKYSNVKSLKKVTKALTKGKTYYVKVRANYSKSAGNGAWSTVKSVKCK